MTEDEALLASSGSDRWPRTCWSLSRAPEGKNESDGKRVIVAIDMSSTEEKRHEARTPRRSRSCAGGGYGGL